MTSALAALIVAAASFVQPAQSPPGATVTTSADVIAEARVHGNHLTTDAEILELSGITIGAPFGPDTIKNIHARLEATGRFRDVEVLKRFASIIDPSQIVVVIIVNEGPVRVEVPDEPNAPIRVVKRRGPTNVMYAPMLNGEDGYGLTYGVRVAYVGIGGPRGRVSFPLTWGGTKRAGAEFDWPLSAGPFTRVQSGQPSSAGTIRRSTWTTTERGCGVESNAQSVRSESAASRVGSTYALPTSMTVFGRRAST